MIDYQYIKNTLNSIAELYVYPQQLKSESSINSYSYPTLLQSFIPFSTKIDKVEFYIHKIIGTPGSISVSILNKDKGTIATKSISPSIGWNTITFNLEDRISKYTHYIELKNTDTATNYSILGASTSPIYEGKLTSDTSTLKVNLTFKAIVPDYIKTVYPRRELAITGYPIIVSDISGRPRVFQRYIDPKKLEQVITVTYNIFSRYPSEIDMISRRLERAFVRERVNIQGVNIVTLGRVTPMTVWRENIFTRGININLRLFTKE